MTTAELNILVRVHARAAAAEIRALQTQLAAMKAQAATTGAAGAAAGTAVASAAGGTKSISALRNLGSQLQWTGRQLSQNFTAPLAIAGGFAVKWALDNEAAMTQVRKVYGDLSTPADQVKNETDALQKNFVALSNAYGVNADEVTNVAAEWAAAGASGTALAKSTELTMQAMVLGNMNAADATEGLVAIQAQYGLTSDSLKRTLAELNIVENQTGVGLSGLIDGFSRAAGTARTAGVDTEHLSAMMAALVPATGSAATAGNGLKTIMARLLGPTKDAAGVLDEMGINTADMSWKTLDASKRLELLSQKFMGLDAAQQNSVSNTVASIYQISRFGVLMRDMASDTGYYRKALNTLTDSTKVAEQMSRELETVLRSNPLMMKKAGQVIKNSLVEAIIPLVPLLAYVATKFGELMQAFNRLNPMVKKLVMVILMFIAVLGPLIMMLGTVYLAIWTLRKGFVSILPFILGMGKALLFPITGLATLAGRIALTSASLLANTVIWALSASTMSAVGKILKLTGLAYLGFARILMFVGSVIKMVATTQAVWNALMIAQTAVRVWALIAIEKAGAVARLVIDKVSNALRLATNSGFYKAMLAIQKAYHTAAWAVLKAWTAVYAFADMASISIRIAIAQTFWAAVHALDRAGMSLRLLLIQSHGALAIAIEKVQGAVRLAITKAQLAALVVVERVSYAARLVIAKVYWAAAVVAEAVGGAARMAIFRAQWVAMLAWERISQAARILIAKAHWVAMLAVDLAQSSARVAIQKIHWGLLIAIEKAGHLARITINAVHWAALLAAEKIAHGVRIVMNTAAWVLFNSITAAGWARNIAIWVVAQGGILAMTKKFFMMIPLLFTRGLKSFARIFIGPWGLAIAGVVALLVVFKDHIKTFINTIIQFFRQMPAGIARGFDPIIGFFRGMINGIVGAFHKLPAGVQTAMMAVVNLVKAAAKAVYKLFSYINPFAHHSPSLVENVTNGMAAVSDQFAGAESNIKGSMMNSYDAIKKFGQATAAFRKQADAIDNAKKRKEIGEMAPGSLGAYDSIMATLEQLKPQLEAAEAAVEAQEAVVKRWDDAVKNADKNIKGLEKTLDVLKDRASQVSDRLDAAKDSVSRFADASITGMRAAENATFANEMAQKQLQLQIAQTNAQYGGGSESLWATEDAVFENQMAQKRLQLQIAKTNEELNGGADGVLDRYAKMQGEIENLMGAQTDLRNKGAGSDITRVYDEMIAGVRGAQDALTAPGNAAASPVKDLKDQLDALQRQAEIMDLEKALKLDPLTHQAEVMTRTATQGLERLKGQADIMDLENSLRFDPLSRQIQQMNDGLNEMPFDVIISGMRASQADVARYTAELDQANAAVANQQAMVDAATAARDQLSEAYDLESEKLTMLKDRQEALNKAIQDGTSAIDSMNSAISAVKGESEYISPGVQNFRDAAGGDFADPGDNATIGREGGPGDQTAAIEQMTKDMVLSTGDMFAGLDLFKPIKEKWNQFTGWWSRTVTPAWSIIVDGFGSGFDAVKNAGNPFVEISNSTEGTFGVLRSATTGVRDFAKGVGEWTKNIWDLFSPSLVDTGRILWENLLIVWEKLKPSLMNLGTALKDILPVLAAIAGAVLLVIKVVWEMINGAIGPVFNVIGTLLASIVDVISGVLKYIAGAFNTIVGMARMFIGLFKGIFTGDWSMFSAGWDQVKKGFGQMVSGIVDVVKGLGTAILSVFKNLPLLVWNVVWGFVVGVIDFFKWLYDVLVGHSIIPDLINAIVQWFKDLPGMALQWIVSFVVMVVEWMASLPGKVWNALASLGSVIGDLLRESASGWKVIFTGGWNQIVSWAKQVPGMVWNAILSLGGIVKNFLGDAANDWKLIFQLGWNKIVEWAKGVPGMVWNAVLGLKSKLGDLGREAIDYMRQKIVDTSVKVFDFFKSLPGKIIDNLKGLPGQMIQMGKDTVQGLLDGAKEKAKDVATFFTKDLPGKILGGFKSALGIASPSKEMTALGLNVSEGVAVGMKAGEPGVKDAVNSLAAVVSSPPVDTVKFTEAFDEIGKSTDDLKSKVGNLKSALGEVREQQFSDMDQQVATQTAIQGVADAFANAGTSAFTATGQLDIATEGGRRVYNSMKDVTTAYDEAMLHAFESARGQGKSQGDAALAAQVAGSQVVQSFINTAKQAGLSDGVINNMITTMNLIPPQKFTDIIVRDEEARKVIEQFVNDHAGANAIRIGVELGVTGDPLQRALMPQNYKPTTYSTQLPGMPPGRAKGGLIHGPGTGISDSIMGMDRQGIPTAMVSNREYVVNAKSTLKWLPILEAINRDTLGKFKDGGLVGAKAAMGAASAGATSATGGVSLALSMDANLHTNVTDEIEAMTSNSSGIFSKYVDMTQSELRLLQGSFDATFRAIESNTSSTNLRMQTTLAGQNDAFISDAEKDYLTFSTTIAGTLTGLSTTSNGIFATMRDQNNARTAEMQKSITDMVVALVNAMIVEFGKLRDQLNSIMTTLRDNSSNLFQNLGDNLKRTMDNTIVPMFNSFLPMLQTVEGWFTNSVANIGRIWDGMREAVAAPSRFVVDQVYNNGVRKAWNNVNTWLKLPELPEHKANFRTGGPVIGPGGPRADKIPAMLSNGEHVIPANEVRAAGGQQGIYQLRQVIRQGELPHFANGGAVTWPQLNQIRQELYPGSLLNDWVRPGANDYHGWNQAIDIGWAGNNVAQLTRIANDLGRRFGSNITELIHKPGGSIKHGKTMAPNQWGPGVWDQHWNHVHWAMTPQALAAALGGASMPAGLLPDASGGGFAPTMADNVRAKWDEIMGPIERSVGTNLIGVDMVRRNGFDEFAKIGTFLKGTADKISAESGIASGGMGMPVEKFGSNMDIMKRTAAQFGWGEGPEWDALHRLEMKEAGYNNLAQNPISTAYGMGQFLDSTWAPYGPKTSDPALQSLYMMRYIQGRYGSPSGALNHHLKNNWYDQGGYMMPGSGVYHNETGKPEPVFTATQWQTLKAAVYNGLTLQGYDKSLAKEINENLAPTLKNYGLHISGVQEWTRQDVVDGVNQVVRDVQTVAENVVTAAQQQINNAVQIGNQMAHDWLASVGILGTDFQAGLNAWGLQIQTGFVAVQNAITTLAPDINSQIEKLAPKVNAEIAGLAPAFTQAMATFQADPAGTLERFLPQLVGAAGRLAPSVNDAINSLAPKFQAALTGTAQSVNGSFNSIVDAINNGQSVTPGMSLPVREGVAAGAVQPTTTTITNHNNTTIHMNGDLIFPGFSGPDGAEKFVANLKTRAGVQ